MSDADLALVAEFESAALAQLATLRAKLAARLSEHDVLGDLARAAHDLHGQGASFGYPLVTQVARSLDRLVSAAPLGLWSQSLPRALEMHLEALTTIIGKKIRGDAGLLGERLMRQLAAMRP